jgi:hypothetical protein
MMSFKKFFTALIALFLILPNANFASDSHTLKFICKSTGKIIVIKKINRGGYDNIFCIIDKIQFNKSIEINIDKYNKDKNDNEELIFIEQCPDT